MNLRRIASRCRVVVEDRFFTAPSSSYVPRYSGDEAELARRVVELRQRGYTSLGKLLDDDELVRVRSLIGDAVDGKQSKVSIRWSEKVRYWQIVNPLRLDTLFLRLAAHPSALAIGERYFQRQPYLSDVDLRRIPPVAMSELEQHGYSSSNWHRDSRGRQLKLMIYLSDVGESDSNFALVPTTHIGQSFRKNSYEETRVSDSEAASLSVQSLEWYGRAGEAMMFDTNLIHRLRRKPSARVRDSVTFYYTPGQALMSLDVDPLDVGRLPETMRATFGDPAFPFKRYRHS